MQKVKLINIEFVVAKYLIYHHINVKYAFKLTHVAIFNTINRIKLRLTAVSSIVYDKEILIHLYFTFTDKGSDCTEISVLMLFTVTVINMNACVIL